MKGGQKTMYSDAELNLMKTTFSENEPLLKAIRKTMLQLELSEGEDKMLKGTFKTKEVQDLIRHVLSPSLDGDAPYFQLVDMWTVFQLEGQKIEETAVRAKSNKLFIDLLDQGLKTLAGETVKKLIVLDDLTNIEGKDSEEIYINMFARNLFIKMVDKQVSIIDMLAGVKEETIEETLERLSKDSTK